MIAPACDTVPALADCARIDSGPSADPGSRTAARSGADAGFSLVELAVYIAILGLIATIVATVMVSLFRSQQTVSALSDASNDTQNFAVIFDRDVRNSRSVTPVTSGAHLSIDLQTASAASACYETITYSIESGELLRNGARVFGFTLLTGSGFTVDEAGRTIDYDLVVEGPGGSAQAVEATARLGPANPEGSTC